MERESIREKEKGEGTVRGGGNGERRKGKGQATEFFWGTHNCGLRHL